LVLHSGSADRHRFWLPGQDRADQVGTVRRQVGRVLRTAAGADRRTDVRCRSRAARQLPSAARTTGLGRQSTTAQSERPALAGRYPAGAAALGVVRREPHGQPVLLARPLADADGVGSASDGALAVGARTRLARPLAECGPRFLSSLHETSERVIKRGLYK